MQEKKSTYVILSILAIIAVMLIAASSRGTFVNRGTVSLLSLPADTAIFIDQTKYTTTTTAVATTTEHLTPGTHSFILSVAGYFPWQKTIRVSVDKPEILRPLFIPENPIFTPVAQNTPVYQSTTDLLTTPIQRTATSTSGNVVIHLANDTIVAEWKGGPLSTLPSFFCGDTGCDTPHTVISSSVEHISNALFYPTREDAVIFVIGNVVGVRELDSRTTQNYFPIYQGISPEIALQGNTLFIKDANHVLSTELP